MHISQPVSHPHPWGDRTCGGKTRGEGPVCLNYVPDKIIALHVYLKRYPRNTNAKTSAGSLCPRHRGLRPRAPWRVWGHGGQQPGIPQRWILRLGAPWPGRAFRTLSPTFFFRPQSRASVEEISPGFFCMTFIYFFTKINSEVKFYSLIDFHTWLLSSKAHHRLRMAQVLFESLI